MDLSADVDTHMFLKKLIFLQIHPVISSLNVLHSPEHTKRFTELGKEEKGEGIDRGDLVEKKDPPQALPAFPRGPGPLEASPARARLGHQVAAHAGGRGSRPSRRTSG